MKNILEGLNSRLDDSEKIKDQQSGRQSNDKDQICISFIYLFILSRPHVQCEAWIQDPEIQSRMQYWLS